LLSSEIRIFVTPHYTVLKGNSDQPEVYRNKTGELIDLDQNPILKKKVEKWQQYVNDKLKLSDTINNKNLLRFYTPTGFTPVNPKNYDYQNEIQKLVQTRNDLGLKSTSVYSQNNNKSTTNLYTTDAPELNGDRTYIDSWSSILKEDSETKSTTSTK
jgi:Phosphoglycerol transferase and related proteins, alkaline phosphatase superfamily